MAPREVFREPPPHVIVKHEAMFGRTDEGELAQLAERGTDIVTARDGGQRRFIELANRSAPLQELSKAWVSNLDQQPLHQRPDDQAPFRSAAEVANTEAQGQIRRQRKGERVIAGGIDDLPD
jgi:hypothetical protein